MDFREATDRLCEKLSHDDLAKELGVSVQGIRQARMSDSAKARRQPPKHWPFAVIRLAERQIMESRKLIEQVRKEVGKEK